jgi:hypothetical protein
MPLGITGIMNVATDSLLSNPKRGGVSSVLSRLPRARSDMGHCGVLGNTVDPWVPHL